MTLINIYMAIAVVATFFSFYLSIIILAKKDESLNEKLKRFTSWQPPQTTVVSNVGWKNLLQFASKLAPKKLSSRYEKDLVRAGVPLSAEEFLVIRLFSFFISGLLSFALIQSLPTALMIGMLGYIIPIFWLSKLKKDKLKLFNNQLADSLLILANSLRSGFSLFQAMEMVSQEMPDPISLEFRQTLREMTYGTATENALTHLSERVGSDDLELMVTAILIQRQVGGNLAEILTNIHETIQDRLQIQQEIRTLTSQGRISGYIISALPFGLAGILMVLNPTYLTKLFIHPIGWFMLGTGLIMQVLGFFTIRKIIDIKF